MRCQEETLRQYMQVEQCKDLAFPPQTNSLCPNSLTVDGLQEPNTNVTGCIKKQIQKQKTAEVQVLHITNSVLVSDVVLKSDVLVFLDVYSLGLGLTGLGLINFVSALEFCQVTYSASVSDVVLYPHSSTVDGLQEPNINVTVCTKKQTHKQTKTAEVQVLHTTYSVLVSDVVG